MVPKWGIHRISFKYAWPLLGVKSKNDNPPSAPGWLGLTCGMKAPYESKAQIRTAVSAKKLTTPYLRGFINPKA